MEVEGNQAEVLVTDKNCLTLVGKRVKIVFSDEVKTDIGGSESIKVDEVHATKDIADTKGVAKIEPNENSIPLNEPSGNQQPEVNGVSTKTKDKPIDKTDKISNSKSPITQNGIATNDINVN